MKNKPKYLLLFFITLFIFIATIGILTKNNSQTTKKTIESIPLNYENIRINFYYDQLNSIEKNVYNKILNNLNVYKGGEIILDENISVNNLSRIADALRFNNDNNYFYLLLTFPLTSNNKIVNWGTNQSNEILEKKQISKILLLLYIGKNDTRLDKFNISDDFTITNYDEVKKSFENIPNELINKYEEIKNNTDTILENIISNIPSNLSQEEAVNYFSQWLINNMNYTSSFSYGTNYGDIVNEEIQFSSYISSITNKSAICSGLSMILSELCRKVGIESYICLGTVSNGGSPYNHAWVAVNIGGTVYYKDPTREISAKKVYPLKTKEELTKGNYILRFSKHFNY
ncbi:transglutaminase domain-containing protein [Clostridium celatum]|uniref:transglutaminase domain-containing protein n=1 Tax=Clostridium celatum TaxID=36834 RepID=UPI001897993F|nr:transglutaminase domain-containing protein [Clostridium celatum]